MTRLVARNGKRRVFPRDFEMTLMEHSYDFGLCFPVVDIEFGNVRAMDV